MKTLFQWYTQTNLTNKNLIFLIVLAVIESLCNLLLPLSSANIITSASIQFYTKTRLWIIIHLLISILTILITNYTNGKITSLKKIIRQKNNNSHSDEATTFSNAIVLFYNYLKFITKTILIIIFTVFFDYILAIILTTLIIICYNLNRLKTHKIGPLSNYIWPLALTIVLLLLNNNLQINKLTLSSFLIISTFINNHLLKTDLFPNHFNEIKQIKTLLLNNNTNQNNMHKKTNFDKY